MHRIRHRLLLRQGCSLLSLSLIEASGPAEIPFRSWAATSQRDPEARSSVGVGSGLQRSRSMVPFADAPSVADDRLDAKAVPTARFPGSPFPETYDPDVAIERSLAYFRNTRALAAHCNRRGIDMRPFVSAYEARYHDEIESLKSFFAGKGEDFDASWFQGFDVLEAEVAAEIADAARVAEVAPASICRAMALNPSYFAEAYGPPHE